MLQAIMEDSMKEREDLLVVSELLRFSNQLAIRNDSAAVGVECAVCIEELQSTEQYRELPCGHQFHSDCIDPWLEQSVTCPMCTASIVDTASPADLEIAREKVEEKRSQR